jgi:hypothetical protein
MIAEELLKQAGKKYRSTDWWVNSLMNELSNYQKEDINQEDTGFIEPGDFIFFLYNAKYPQKYQFWDLHPLVYVLEIDMSKGLFLGSNIHYLNPKYRSVVVNSHLNTDSIMYVPRKTLHNYLFSGVITEMFKIPKGEWEGISQLPTEKFVDKRGQPVFKSKVWNYPDTSSSP